MDETTGHADLLRVFDDLEQQAAGLHLEERETEADEVSTIEYAAVDLASRLRAAAGAQVTGCLIGGWQPTGTVLRVGEGWTVLGGPGTVRWLVALAAVTSLAGLGDRAAHPATRSVADGLPLRSALRRLAVECATGAAGATVQLHLADGRRLEGRPGRVGQDFVELRVAAAATDHLVPLGALAAVRWSAC